MDAVIQPDCLLEFIKFILVKSEYFRPEVPRVGHPTSYIQFCESYGTHFNVHGEGGYLRASCIAPEWVKSTSLVERNVWWFIVVHYSW